MKYLISVLLFLISTGIFAQDLTTKANTFIASLDAKSKADALYSLDDKERFNWHFVPRERKGACFRNFSEAQRAAAMTFLKASLSEQGFGKATSIMALENVLREIEKLGPDDKYRDPLNYYITFFGTPDNNKPWGWRLEGHHVAINFASQNNQIVSSTPSFFGSNPAIVPAGKEKGKQILKQETDLGVEMRNSLTDAQKSSAIISEKALPEIISFNSRKAVPLTPAGLGYKQMTEAQQKLLLRLLDVYVRNYELGFSNRLMDKIKKAGIENLSFAWAGSTTPGEGSYYRIQGPMLLIEYDNTQTNANHVHAAVRDLTNDFAEDILREHYQAEHPKK